MKASSNLRSKIVLLICVCCLLVARTHGQEHLDRRVIVERFERLNWGWYSPVDAITARVLAHSQLLRADAAAAVDYAQAREIRADAFRKEIINSVARVQAYWDRKAIYEAEQLRRRGNYLDKEKNRASKTWDRLRNHPDLLGDNVINGNALNFLQDRLSGTILAYNYTRTDSEADRAILEHVRLAPNVIHGLRLRQNAGSGDQISFRADEGVALDTHWWPYLLRTEELAVYRDAFEMARAAVMHEAERGTVSVVRLQQLDDALLKLGDEFSQSFPSERIRTSSSRVRRQYRSAQDCLRSLDGEIGRLQSTGRTQAFDGTMQFNTEVEGDHLIALMSFMARRGLDFAPATPGDEPAYHTVFRLMKDLYVTVADDDESIEATE